MDRDETAATDPVSNEEPILTDAQAEPVVNPNDSTAPSEATEEVSPDERPVSETIGTGSFFGIGCTIFALLFVCVGVAIFMWRQVN